MKKKVRVRQRVSKVRVLRNEKTLPQRKMYTPRVKLCGCTWVFTIGDAENRKTKRKGAAQVTFRLKILSSRKEANRLVS